MMVVKNLKRTADGPKESSGEGNGKRSKAEKDIFEILRGGEVKKEKCYVIHADKTSDYTVPLDAPIVATATTTDSVSTTSGMTVGGDNW